MCSPGLEVEIELDKKESPMLEVPPGVVAEGDACHWRTNPPQSPTQSIDWCGVVQAVHLRSIGATAAATDGVRLSEVRTRDFAAKRASSERVTEFMLLRLAARDEVLGNCWHGARPLAGERLLVDATRLWGSRR